MSSFLAILKDSLREALATTVFYFMVGMSVLVILFVATVGYRPVPVEQEARRLTDLLTFILSMRMEGVKKDMAEMPRWEVKDFEQTEPAARPWETGYRFAMVVDFASSKMAKQARAEQQQSVSDIENILRSQLYFLRDVHVEPQEPREPTELRFLVTSAGGKTSSRHDWPHEGVILGLMTIPVARPTMGSWLWFWEDLLVGTFGAAAALLVSSIITAFFIPNMLHKGTIDLLLVKPLPRWWLLLCKYIGGLLFIFLNTILIVGGVWLVLGIRTGTWGPGFLMTIFVLMFQFALYYAVSTLFAVLTRSPIVAILMVCLSWLLFSIGVGYGYRAIDSIRKQVERNQAQAEIHGEAVPNPQQDLDKAVPTWLFGTADAVHMLTPHLKDLDALTTKWIKDDIYPPDSQERKAADRDFAKFPWAEVVIVNSLYIAVLLAISCWWFATRDY